MYGRISPTRMSFFLLKQLTSPQRAKQSLDMMVSGVTKMSPFNDSCSNSRSDTEWIWLKKTKLFLTLNLSGALIHYWFVVGEKTGSGPIILIMGLCSSLYYDWDEDVTMVWEQSSFFVLRTFLPNWIMCTTGFRTLTHQTPSVSVLLLGKKSQCFVSQFYNSWLTQEHSGWHGYVRKKTWPKYFSISRACYTVFGT